jgi:hypothetical protein
MIVGNARKWLREFRDYDDQFLSRVATLINNCVKCLGDNPSEDEITINLVEYLVLDPVIRGLFHTVEYQFEPTRTDNNGIARSLGKIDMAAHIVDDRKTYLAYECKRLNVINGTATRSLATPYVTEGVVRFVKEKYSEGLPIGCMLGYVLDGDTANAKFKICAALTENLELIAKQGRSANNLSKIPRIIRFSTKHKRKNSSSIIEIRHALVACT